MPHSAPDNQLELHEALETLSRDIFAPQAGAVQNIWLEHLRQAPHASLLTENIFNQTITNANQLYLVSAVEKTGNFDVISAGMGCLGNVVYCVQAFPKTAPDYELHNFGTVVMRHRGSERFAPILFQFDTARLRVGKVNYLNMGALLDEIRRDPAAVLRRPTDREAFSHYRAAIEQACGRFIATCQARFDDQQDITEVQQAITLIDDMVAGIYQFKSLSYVYFEAVSLALMLHSQDDETVALKQRGEFNHLPYIELVHRHKSAVGGDEFASYEFAPTYAALAQLLEAMQADGVIAVDMDELTLQIARNIVFYMGNCYNTPEAIRGNIFYDFCSTPDNFAMLRPRLDEAMANLLAAYMQQQRWDLVINSAIEKGEIGINPRHTEHLQRIALTAYNDDRTRVHEQQTLAATLQPITVFGKETLE